MEDHYDAGGVSGNLYKFLLALQMTWAFLRGIPTRILTEILEEFHSHLWPKTDLR